MLASLTPRSLALMGSKGVTDKERQKVFEAVGNGERMTEATVRILVKGNKKKANKASQKSESEKIKSLKGNLLIKYFPPKGVSSKKVAQHIDKMIANDNKPDLIIIDYADLLLSHSNKTDSTYAEQGGVYIDLRGMSGELGIPIWTASQANRSAIDSEVIEADKIADSYAKVMNADFIMSWSRKSKDKLNNTARCHIMKNRFGPDGITFPCKMDTNTGFIEVYEGTSAEGILSTKEAASGNIAVSYTHLTLPTKA